MTVLYGVSFRGQIEFSILDGENEFPFEISFSAKPSKELLKHIGSLPRGSSIFIDGCSPENHVRLQQVIDGFRLEPTNNSKYLEKILDVCIERGIRRTFLETPSHFASSASRFARIAKLERQLLQDEEDIPDYTREILQKERYALTVEYNYHNTILFEQEVLEKVRENAPAIVILPDPQANYLFYHNDDVFSTYHREQLPENDLLMRKVHDAWKKGKGPLTAEKYLLENMVSNRLVKDAPREHDVFEHETVRRKFSALKHRRITNGFPDFLGSWGPLPERGVMELYITNIDGDRVSGIVEDVYKTTSFHGKISSKHIEFSRMLPDSDGNEREAFYYAELEGQEYSGMYEHPEISGTFRLWPFRTPEC